MRNPNCRLASFDKKVEFIGNKQRANDIFLKYAIDILWDLVIQGIIRPGNDSGGFKLPFFRITEYGAKVLKEKEYTPHDPENYLKEYYNAVKEKDSVAIEYLKESLRCFNNRCYVAANMMLGIASERVFNLLCEALSKALADAKEKKYFDGLIKGNQIKVKAVFVQDKVKSIMTKTKIRQGILSENTQVYLDGIFNFIRIQRNAIGHPQDKIQISTKYDVNVNLLIFPKYCQSVVKLKKYFKRHKV